MKALINKLIISNTGFDTLPIRLAAGAVFAAHGAKNYSACSAVTVLKVQLAGWSQSVWGLACLWRRLQVQQNFLVVCC